MSESVFYAFCLIFALVGLYYAFESLYCYFLCERNCRNIYTVIYHFEEEESLPDKVYSAMLLSRHNSFGKRQVYVIDSEFSDNIKLKCQLITKEMGTVHFIKREELRVLYKINTDSD